MSLTTDVYVFQGLYKNTDKGPGTKTLDVSDLSVGKRHAISLAGVIVGCLSIQTSQDKGKKKLVWKWKEENQQKTPAAHIFFPMGLYVFSLDCYRKDKGKVPVGEDKGYKPMKGKKDVVGA